MKKYNEEINSFLRDWVEAEGLCRFCDVGRMCRLSRRGRQICPAYRFSREMDCFHLWIAHFDGEPKFRQGYDTADSYPWENEGPEADDVSKIRTHHPRMTEMDHNKTAMLKQLSSRKHLLMQRLQDYPIELEKIVEEIKKYKKNNQKN